MKEYIGQNLNAYNKLAIQYKGKMGDYIEQDNKTSSIFRVYLKINFKAIRVLELGVGAGLTLSNFEKEGFDVTGIDFSDKMIEVAKSVALKTKFLLGDFGEYDFGDLKYEGIYAQAFIHLFPLEDARKALNKIFELLELNGVAHISTTVHDKSEEGFFEKDDYTGDIKRFRKKWKEDELLNEIEKVGFLINKKVFIDDPANNGKKWLIIVAVKEKEFS